MGVIYDFLMDCFRTNKAGSSGSGSGDTGANGQDGQLIGCSTEVFALNDGKMRVTHSAAPVAVRTDKGTYYPLEKGSVTSDSTYWYIDPAPYLAYDNSSSFSGTWTVYFAGGVAPSYDAYVYGVDYDTAIATAASACKRVVLNAGHDESYDPLRYLNVDSFAQLPAHNLRRCVMSDLANRTVAYYLNASDSTKKEDGTAADLTGGDGEVMVEFPIAYYRIDTYTDSSSHTHIVKLISDRPFPGSAPFPAFYVSNGGATLQKQYIGAFKASVDANSKCRSVTGVKPTVSLSRAQFRTDAASNGGSLANTLMKVWIGWLAEIEFASTDVQATISKGFSEMAAYNSSYLRYCGRTVALGNGTGEIIADSEGADSDLEGHWSTGASKVVACSYRGIEDPWGACWELDDGIQKYQDAVSDDYTKSGYWFTTDTSKYSLLDTNKSYGPADTPFPTAGNTGADTAWVSHAWPKTGGYIKEYDPLTYFPKSAAGSSSTYLCDYLYNDANAGARILLRGGRLENGTVAGAFCVGIFSDLTAAGAGACGRLAC